MQSGMFRAGVLGAALMAFAGTAQATLVFNEMLFDPPAADPTKRFFEIRSTTDTVESLADVSILAIEGDGNAGRGAVEFAFSFGSLSTGANGLALLRDGAIVFQPAPEAATTVVVEPYAYKETTTVTYLLVRGFTGAAESTDIDSNNDGIADGLLPWTEVLDAVGFRDDASEPLYAAQFGGEEFSEADAPYNGADIYGFVRGNSGTRHTFRAAGPSTGPFLVDLSPTLPMGYTLTPGSANAHMPEPGSLALLSIGSLALLRRGRR